MKGMSSKVNIFLFKSWREVNLTDPVFGRSRSNSLCFGSSEFGKRVVTSAPTALLSFNNLSNLSVSAYYYRHLKIILAIMASSVVLSAMLATVSESKFELL